MFIFSCSCWPDFCIQLQLLIQHSSSQVHRLHRLHLQDPTRNIKCNQHTIYFTSKIIDNTSIPNNIRIWYILQYINKEKNEYGEVLYIIHLHFFPFEKNSKKINMKFHHVHNQIKIPESIYQLTLISKNMNCIYQYKY